MLADCQETLFQQMLLDEITSSIRPAIIFEDNMGCIYLTKNQQVGPRTKHIDIRHHFIRQNVANSNIRVCFIPTEENESDIATKNLPEKLFKIHADNLLNGTLPYWIREDVETNSRLTSDLKTTMVGLDPEVSPTMENIKVTVKNQTLDPRLGFKDSKATKTQDSLKLVNELHSDSYMAESKDGPGHKLSELVNEQISEDKQAPHMICQGQLESSWTLVCKAGKTRCERNVVKNSQRGILRCTDGEPYRPKHDGSKTKTKFGKTGLRTIKPNAGARK